jgi:DNA-binding response OmpR family regulator
LRTPFAARHPDSDSSTGAPLVSIQARRTPFKLRKLLVIDDDARLLASYRDLLSPYGFEVLTAPDGQEAIPLVEQNPDILLVILDLAMPRMDGRQWLRWFRTQSAESPVIVISAYKVEPNDPDLTAAAVLEKPFHVAELLDLVGLFCGLGTPPARMA